jgi:HEAT repeat protein
VRFHAIEALGRIRAHDAADALADIALSGDFFLGFAALEAITLIGNRSVASRLLPLLENAMLARPAIGALGQLGDADVVAPLASTLLRDRAPAIEIASALADIYGRYENLYNEGAHIADLTRHAINAKCAGRLIEALAEAGKDKLRSMALVLGWLEGEAVANALARLLGHPTARHEVVEALVRHGGNVVPLLVEKLADTDLETRKAAVIALGRIGDIRAVPDLIRMLRDEADLRIIVAGALARIGDRRAFDGLLELIGDEDAGVRQSAIAALNSLGHPEMPKRMAALLLSPNALVRESAVRIAGYFSYPEVADLLIQLCHDPDLSVRCAAIEQMPFVESSRSVEKLGAALSDTSAKARAAAARALGHIDHKFAQPQLLRALADSDSWVRYFSVRSIARLKLIESIDALSEKARFDEAGQVRVAAVDALGDIGGARVVSILAGLTEADDEELAGAAISALGRVHYPDAIAPLVAALYLPNAKRRLLAIAALRERGGFDAVSVLHDLVKEDLEAPVAQAAIEAFAKIGTQEAVSNLVTLTAKPKYRELCVNALGSLSDEHAHLLTRGLVHNQVEVRLAVIEALARIKQPQSTKLIVCALADPEPAVRISAINSLSHLGSHAAEAQLAELARTDVDHNVRGAARLFLQQRHPTTAA